MDSAEYEFDVAVSFAGAQRSYVEQFVEACKKLDIRVFYDRDMNVDLWGRNLIIEFRKIYGGTSARYFMPFFSPEYVNSPYPLDELYAASEQAFQRNGEIYLLPVRIGEVTIPRELLNPAVAYVLADNLTPAELADLTAQRLGRTTSPMMADRAPASVRMPRIAPASFNPGSALAAILADVGRRFEQAKRELDVFGLSCQVRRTDADVLVQLYEGSVPVCGLSLRYDTFGHDRLAMSFGWPHVDLHGSNGWVTAVWDPDRQAPAADFTDFTDFTRGSVDSIRLSPAKLFEVLWDKIVKHVEQRAG